MFSQSCFITIPNVLDEKLVAPWNVTDSCYRQLAMLQLNSGSDAGKSVFLSLKRRSHNENDCLFRKSHTNRG